MMSSDRTPRIEPAVADGPWKALLQEQSQHEEHVLAILESHRVTLAQLIHEQLQSFTRPRGEADEASAPHASVSAWCSASTVPASTSSAELRKKTSKVAPLRFAEVECIDISMEQNCGEAVLGDASQPPAGDAPLSPRLGVATAVAAVVPKQPSLAACLKMKSRMKRGKPVFKDRTSTVSIASRSSKSSVKHSTSTTSRWGRSVTGLPQGDEPDPSQDPKAKFQKQGRAKSGWARVTQLFTTHKEGTRIDSEDQRVLEQMTELKMMRRVSEVERDKINTDSMKGVLLKMKSNRCFEMTTCFLILCNAAQIGVLAQWQMSNLGVRVPDAQRAFSWIFNVLFTAELLIRIAAEREDFLSWSRNPKNVNWNYFDTFVVVSAYAEELLDHISGGADYLNVSAIRSLRLLRLVRVIKLIRVMRFFKDLRVMVAGIMSSGKSLVWALVLLSLVMYVFGVLFMQVLADELPLYMQMPEHAAMVELSFAYFGTLLLTMSTLFMSIAGGLDWGDVVEPLTLASPLLSVCFVFYVAFGIFACLNIITGVFVENANQMTVKDEEQIIMEQLSTRRQWLHDLREMFEGVGGRDDGKFEWKDFEQHFSSVRVQAYFRKLGIFVDGENAYGIFSLLDFDHDGLVSTDDLISSIHQIHGTARAIDLCRVQHQLAGLERTLGKLGQQIQQPQGEPQILLPT